MNRAELEALLSNINVQAFLRVIREGESDQSDRAFFMRYTMHGPAFIDSLLGGHPRILEPTPTGQKSSASGAWQFTMTTWDYIGKKFGLDDDFSRESQALHAVALLVDCGAISPILTGDLHAAVSAARRHWASLPGSPLQDGGSKIGWARVQSVWDQWSRGAAPIRDSVPEIPAQPVKEEGNMALPVPLIIALGESLLRFLPAFGSGSKVSNRNIEMTQELGKTLIEKAKEVVPEAPNEQGAVQAILDDPLLQKRFTAECAVKWDDIAPFVEAEEKSRKEARNFMLEMTSDGPMWRAVGYGVLVGVTAMIIIVGGGWMLWEATISSWASDAMRQENQAFLRNVILIVVGFIFGSSYSSHRKDSAKQREEGGA
jgi:muramidase (phage lysozyme)